MADTVKYRLSWIRAMVMAELTLNDHRHSIRDSNDKYQCLVDLIVLNWNDYFKGVNFPGKVLCGER